MPNITAGLPAHVSKQYLLGFPSGSTFTLDVSFHNNNYKQVPESYVKHMDANRRNSEKKSEFTAHIDTHLSYAECLK